MLRVFGGDCSRREVMLLSSACDVFILPLQGVTWVHVLL